MGNFFTTRDFLPKVGFTYVLMLKKMLIKSKIELLHAE